MTSSVPFSLEPSQLLHRLPRALVVPLASRRVRTKGVCLVWDFRWGLETLVKLPRDSHSTASIATALWVVSDISVPSP